VSAEVVSVTDGDTIRVEIGGEVITVRLIGIDTPETDGPYTREECWGEQASSYTTRSLEDRTVLLGTDVEQLDRFGRTLAYVWLDGSLFNERLVAEGLAVAVTFPPNVRYAERFAAAQAQARAAEAGIWGACGDG
jgi:micrococcal nuclease